MYTEDRFENVQEDILEHEYVRILMIIMYVITIVLGLVGNGVALKNVRRISPTSSRGVATSTNTLLCSLFVVNLLVLLIVVPVKMLTGLPKASTSSVILSRGLCGFFGYISSVTGVILLWIHCLLGAERCLAVLKPIIYSRFCTAKSAFRLVTGGSIVFLITSLCIPFRTRNTLVLNITSIILPNTTYTRVICDYTRDDGGGYESHVVAYSICILVFLIIPIVGTIVSYTVAVVHLKVLMRQKKTTTKKIDGHDDFNLRRKFIITMLIVLATYVFCWSPLIAFESYRISGKDAFFDSCAFVNVCIWWHVYFICAAAPYIFCGSSPAFRRSVRKLICKQCLGIYPGATLSADVIVGSSNAV